MMFLQQSAGRPGCRELQDDRHPKRLRALRAAVAASVLGWLAFAAALSADPGEARRLARAEPPPAVLPQPAPNLEPVDAPVLAAVSPGDADGR